MGPKRASREGGSSDPSRTAAIGGTRVARNAGQRLATSVTRVPTTSETTTVLVAKTSPVSGRVTPTALNRASRPLASPKPTKIEAAFDNLSHCAVLERVRARVKDKHVLALVKAFLKAGVLTEAGDSRGHLHRYPARRNPVPVDLQRGHVGAR